MPTAVIAAWRNKAVGAVHNALPWTVPVPCSFCTGAARSDGEGAGKAGDVKKSAAINVDGRAAGEIVPDVAQRQSAAVDRGCAGVGVGAR